MARGQKDMGEQVVNLLGQSGGKGKTVPQACKEAEVVEQTYYRWRKGYGGLKVDPARQLIEAWRQEYNESRAHASLDDRTPSEFASQIAASRDLAAT